MSLSDGNKEHLILIEYPRKPEPTVFLFYKSEKGFYVLFINSNGKPFDQNILNILNMEKPTLDKKI